MLPHLAEELLQLEGACSEVTLVPGTLWHLTNQRAQKKEK